MLQVKFDYFCGDKIVYETFSILDCAFEKKLLLSAERNLTDNLLFLTVIKGLTCVSRICLDMLHSLGRSLSPFYLFKSSLVPNEHVGILCTHPSGLAWPL